mmetsp:Transcript_26726/g.58887  ORF Transcript_26726/g.58887 Transcript_26726/m.58887 type:complete len:121 (+) Transcript_26726:9-371(+)
MFGSSRQSKAVQSDVTDKTPKTKLNNQAWRTGSAALLLLLYTLTLLERRIDPLREPDTEPAKLHQKAVPTAPLEIAVARCLTTQGGATSLLWDQASCTLCNTRLLGNSFAITYFLHVHLT